MSTHISLFFLLLGTLAAAAPSSHLTTRATSCSDTSFKNASWVAKDFSFNSSIIFTTPSHAVSGGYLAFSLVNTALDYTMACSASDTRMWEFFYGDQWFNCQGGPDGISQASFRYTNQGESRHLAYVQGTLDIKQRWSCADGPDPIIFSAAGSANLTLGCTITKTQSTDWSMGHSYASQSIQCARQNWDVKVSEISAIA